LDNLTHSLVGLAVAKAGFERVSPRAVVACTIAASLPDFDIVTLIFGGRWAFLQHHRGISHSIPGALLLALAFPFVFYFGDRIVARIRSRPPEIKVPGLMIASIVACATHPFMDWTNNYGIRLLLPWSPKWYYGDFVFIVDPIIWLTFGGACFLLTSKKKFQIVIWALIGSVLTLLVGLGPTQRGGLSDPTLIRILWLVAIATLVLLRRLRVADRWGAKVGIAAFAIAAVYWSGLAYAHSEAAKKAGSVAALIATQNGETITELATMPTLANPLNWQSVFETDRATYRFDLSLTSPPDLSKLIRYEKPPPEATPIINEVMKDKRAQILMGFMRFPVVKVDPNCTSQTLVQFADLRYTEPGGSRGSFSLDLPVDCPNSVNNR
jgi:inner membrane protein